MGRSKTTNIVFFMCSPGRRLARIVKLIAHAKSTDAAHSCPTLLNGEETAIAAAPSSFAPWIRILWKSGGERFRQHCGTMTSARALEDAPVQVTANAAKSNASARSMLIRSGTAPYIENRPIETGRTMWAKPHQQTARNAVFCAQTKSSSKPRKAST